jgi:23S rRNA (guanosine2251-2'-O)-methyltransferase
VAERIEGPNAVREVLQSGRRVMELRVAEGAGRAVEPLIAIARAAGVAVSVVPRKALDAESERGAHQGVVALVEPFRYTPLGAMLDRTAGHEASLLIALDHVTDPGNLGAVMRTASVVGADGVIVPKDRAAAMTPSAYKAAAGGAEDVPVAREPNLVRALEDAKAAGFWVAGASEHAETLAWDAPLDGRLVLVLGAEGEGLSRLVERTCDMLVRLPVTGPVGSLNVSAAAAVLAYEWRRRTARP